MTEQLYEDAYGEVLDRPSSDLIELRWFDSTADISRGEYEDWLTTFAGCVEKARRSSVLIDCTTFRMNPAFVDGPWRDANIIPRYNAAGVSRFAFHFAEGMPMIGAEPAVEAPGRFLTGYFGRRRAALDWLATGSSGSG